ncbi:hypothetical protein ACHAWC_007179 [Mediolabrus comicus]
MNALRPWSYYDAHAQSVDPTEITSSDENAEILRRLRDNDPELGDSDGLWIDQHDYDNSQFDYFVIQEGDDLGWLGYFIERCTVLTTLIIILPEDREQITALFRGIEQSKSIQNLDICGDHVFGEAVLSSVSAMIQSECCSLTHLELDDENFPRGDDVAVALADALKGNKSLTRLLFNPDDLTTVGWSAFSELLCDTSSVSNIHASNHTLQAIGYSSLQRSNYPQARQDVEQLLALNLLTDKHAAIQKILKYHPDFVGPFLGDESKRKLLPLVMSWFESVSRQQAKRSESARVRGIVESVSAEEIQNRHLSTIYKVVRNMPIEATNGYCSYSSRKKEEFDLLGRNFIVMCTLVLFCLLNLRLPTWGDFVASSLCVCLLKLYS